MALLVVIETGGFEPGFLQAYVASALRRFAGAAGGPASVCVPAGELDRLGSLWPGAAVLAGLPADGTAGFETVVRMGGGPGRGIGLRAAPGGQLEISLGPEFPAENEILEAFRAVERSFPEPLRERLEAVVLETGKELGALVIPGSEAGSLAAFPRLLGAIRGHLETLGVTRLAVAVAPEQLESYRALAPGCPVRPLAEALADPAPAMWVFLTPWDYVLAFGPERFPPVGAHWIGRQVFCCMTNGQIRALEFHPDRDSPVVLVDRHCPRLRRNIFSRIANRDHTPKPFIIMTHWYEHEDDGFGPRNEFGHRIKEDFKRLEARPGNHKVVAMYGGSSVNSVFCLHEEMASAVLEAELNGHCRRAGRDLRFSVLNFGLPSAGVLAQLQSYLMFSPMLRPDLVVSLDGINDLIAGVRGDPGLTSQYCVTYSGMAEPLANRFYGRGAAETGYVRDDLGPVRYQGGPKASVRAYWVRKQQFMTVVHGEGGRFVWALQPLAFDRGPGAGSGPGLDPGPTRVRDEALRTMYGLLQRQSPPPEAIAVDLHAAFAARADAAALLADICHTTPAGDRAVAEILARVIIQDALPALLERP